MIKAGVKLIFAGTLFAFLFSCSGNIKKYEQIIAAIRNNEIKVDIPEMYIIQDFSNTTTLKKLPDISVAERGKGKGRIWVLKTKDNLLVIIETKDQGHAGEYGVVYSENGQVPIFGEWTKEWSIDKKITTNWWSISYKLE